MKKEYHIFALNGSHRSSNGFTEIVLNKFITGAQSENATCEVMYPSKQNIISCDSCGNCLFKTPGVCKYGDDMESIIAKMDQADLIVFSSPVYFDSMSSDLKKLIERLRSTLDAYFEFRDNRTYHVKRNAKKKKVVLIFTAGNPERESFITISRIFHRITDNMKWQLEGEFHFPASHLLVTAPDLVSNQLEAVAMCAKELVSKGSIDKKLLKEANKNYINDPEATLKGMTQAILEIRERNKISSI